MKILVDLIEEVLCVNGRNISRTQALKCTTNYDLFSDGTLFIVRARATVPRLFLITLSVTSLRPANDSSRDMRPEEIPQQNSAHCLLRRFAKR